MTINDTMTLDEIIATSAYFGRLSEWLLVTHDPASRKLPLKEILSPGAVRAALDGLAVMTELDHNGVQTLYDFYTDDEKRAQPDKACTKLLYAPGKPNAPFVVVCPGGGYQDVWTIAEGVNSLAELSQMGYHVFSLVYRVSREKLMPKPMEDLAAAIRFVRAHAEDFSLNKERYSVAGYSAGGHLAASWGCNHHGWRAHGLPKPDALFLGYAALSTMNYYDDIAAGIGGKKYARDGLAYLSHFAAGELEREALAEYSVELHVDADYPPTYMIHSKDDPDVHYQTSVLLAQSLQEAGIPHVLESVNCCGHGFAVGWDTQADGWLKRAVDFCRSQV